jgi:succinoglycan biosynthesis protein ExoA
MEYREALIVIPCLNEEEHLPGLLADLARDAPGALIVVADGGSSDRSRAIVEECAAANPDIRLLDNPKRIQSAALNLAAQVHGAGRKWLIRADAHSGYPAGFVGGLIAAAERTGAVSVTVPMRTRGVGCFQRAAAAAQNSLLGTGGSFHRVGTAGRFVDHGHHALMRLDAFLAVGGYCEAFTHNEDAELDHRLRERGGRIWIEPDLAIDYYPRAEPGALFRQYFRYGEGRARTVARHRMPLKARQLAPLLVAPAVAAAVAAPLAWWMALPAVSWVIGSLGFGLLLGLRARDVCAGGSGIAAMLMHLGWSLGYWRHLLFGKPLVPPPQPIVLG